MRVLVLGAGFGGLELTTKLSEEFGEDVEIVLVDKSDSFVFGFSKLDVMFGHATADHVRHRYADIVKPGVTFVQAEITSIDAQRKSVETSAGNFSGDILVIGLGADLHPEETPGMLEAGHEFYTVEGAFAVREVIENFPGGRVVIGVVSAPFKCPPAPSETALLMHELLTDKGLRDQSSIALVMPFGRPIPPSPGASEALLGAFEERDIEWHAQSAITHLDPAKKTAVLSDGSELEFDLFLGVPHHRAPAVVLESGITVEGWIPVDPLTLETPIEGVYAIGDVAAVGTPRAGVFAEGQAMVAADGIAAKIRESTSDSTYGGRGVCYIEFGGDQVGMVDVTFIGDKKTGELIGPDAMYVTNKAEFGSSRIKRWFGNEWSTK
jgi:sulfide:quinone oxidoreductase